MLGRESDELIAEFIFHKAPLGTFMPHPPSLLDAITTESGGNLEEVAANLDERMHITIVNFAHRTNQMEVAEREYMDSCGAYLNKVGEIKRILNVQFLNMRSERQSPNLREHWDDLLDRHSKRVHLGRTRCSMQNELNAIIGILNAYMLCVFLNNDRRNHAQ